MGDRKKQKSMFYLDFPSGEELEDSIPFHPIKFHFLIRFKYLYFSGNVGKAKAVISINGQLTVLISFMRVDNLALDTSIQSNSS